MKFKCNVTQLVAPGDFNYRNASPLRFRRPYYSYKTSTRANDCCPDDFSTNPNQELHRFETVVGTNFFDMTLVVKKIRLLAFMSLLTSGLFSQNIQDNMTSRNKPVIDLAAIDNWVSVHEKTLSISDNGKFICYGTQSPSQYGIRLVLQSVDGSWKKTVGPVRAPYFFSDDSRFFLYSDLTGKILYIVHIGKDLVEEFKDVKAWGKIDDGKYEYLVFLLSDGMLRVRNLATGKQTEIGAVDRFYAIRDEGISECIFYASAGSNVFSSYNLKNGTRKIIADKFKPEQVIFSQSGNQVAFTTTDTASKKNNHSIRAIWYYDIPLAKVLPIMSDTSSCLDKSSFIEGINGFCADDSAIMIGIKQYLPDRGTTGSKADVAIWGYQDSLLQSFKDFSELPKRSGERFCGALYLLSSRRFMYLGAANTEAGLQSGRRHFLISQKSSNPEDASWNPYISKGKMLGVIDARNGSWAGLDVFEQGNEYSFRALTPDCRFIFCYDKNIGSFFNYEIASGKKIQVGKDVSNAISIDFDPGIVSPRWINEGKSVIVQSGGNLWLLDLTGRTPSKIITNGIGTPDMSFRFLLQDVNEQLIASKEYYVIAFNKKTKANSFYAVTPDGHRQPRLLHSAEALYYAPNAHVRNPIFPLKAKKAEVYLLSKMTAKESRNVFTTTDFKEFRQQSFVYPEKQYNWLSTELLNCPLPGGGIGQGILYKPEDFDPAKKYPVIIDYYESKSDNLNFFIEPMRMDADADIPWFVSRGYLVLSMDIEYETGKAGASANKYINAGADYLSTLSYVNKEKMGLFGHSYGGFETNYIVTHSTRFAAAVSSAGIANMVSLHGDIWDAQRKSSMFFVMYGQPRMGTTPWEDPAAFIDNSAVFHVDKVQTPMLIHHNFNDGNVPVSQSIALFTSLRRCGKPAWLIQYSKANHILYKKEYQTDYTNRVTQFFDHYLKGKPMPCWMSSQESGQFKRDCEEVE